MSLALSLTTWTQQNIISIYNATVRSDFDRSFDHFLSQDVHITYNDKSISRQQYKQHLIELKFPEQKVTVAFNGLVGSADQPAHGPLETGLVGAFYEATITQGEIGGRPTQINKVIASFIADVDNDKSVIPNPPVTDFDARRVFKFTVVESDHITPL